MYENLQQSYRQRAYQMRKYPHQCFWQHKLHSTNVLCELIKKRPITLKADRVRVRMRDLRIFVS